MTDDLMSLLNSDTTVRNNSYFNSKAPPSVQLEEWLLDSRPGEAICYAKALYLFHNLSTRMARFIFWEAYERGLVELYQKKIHGADRVNYFHYYAVRTTKRLTRKERAHGQWIDKN